MFICKLKLFNDKITCVNFQKSYPYFNVFVVNIVQETSTYWLNLLRNNLITHIIYYDPILLNWISYFVTLPECVTKKKKQKKTNKVQLYSNSMQHHFCTTKYRNSIILKKCNPKMKVGQSFHLFSRSIILLKDENCFILLS